MAENVCTQCGGKHESPGREGLCYGCQLDSLVPVDYEFAEDYVFDPTWRHLNAMRHPPTGVALLDESPGQTIREMLMLCRHRPREA